MIDPHELAEEELVRYLAAAPAVPAGLRQRVLTEAMAAESRRAGARRTALVTGTLVLAMGLVLGLGPSSKAEKAVPRPEVVAASSWDPVLSRPTAVALLTDRAETIATAGIGEWDQVEVFVLLRQAGRIAVSGTP